VPLLKVERGERENFISHKVKKHKCNKTVEQYRMTMWQVARKGYRPSSWRPNINERTNTHNKNKMTIFNSPELVAMNEKKQQTN